MPDLINIKEVAKMCGCSTKTISRRIKEGKFPERIPNPSRPGIRDWERIHIERFMACGSIERYNELYLDKE